MLTFKLKIVVLEQKETQILTRKTQILTIFLH